MKLGIFEKNTPTSIKDKMEKLTFSAIVGASVISTKIGSF